MKIAVISDTHIHKHPEKIIELLNKNMKDADMIIDAGDYTDIRVLKILMNYKKFIGVYGNNNKSDIRNVIKEKEILKIERFKIGIFHGTGDEKAALESACNTFKSSKVDIIIFGHSHKPLITTRNKILVLNPGSFTSRKNGAWHSYIILEIAGNSIHADLKLLV